LKETICRFKKIRKGVYENQGERNIKMNDRNYINRSSLTINHYFRGHNFYFPANTHKEACKPPLFPNLNLMTMRVFVFRLLMFVGLGSLHSQPTNNKKSYKFFLRKGNRYFKSGEYAKAITNYKKVIEIREQSLGQDDIQIASMCDEFCAKLISIDAYYQASHFCIKSVIIYENTLEKNHPQTVAAVKAARVSISCDQLKNYDNLIRGYKRKIDRLPKIDLDRIINRFSEVELAQLAKDYTSLGMAYRSKALVITRQELFDLDCVSAVDTLKQAKKYFSNALKVYNKNPEKNAEKIKSVSSDIEITNRMISSLSTE